MATDLILYPAASTDDGDFAASILYITSQTQMELGKLGTESDRAWIRFPNATIPKGATISSAKITFCAWDNETATTVNIRIWGNLADNATYPTDLATANALAKTINYVDWSGISAWTQDEYYDTPDLAVLIQEIVNQSGWSSGNAIQIIIWNNSSTQNAGRRAYTWDGGVSAKYAKLSINYTYETVARSITAILNLAPFLHMASTMMRGNYGDIDASLVIPISASGTIDVVQHAIIDSSLVIPLVMRGTINSPEYFYGEAVYTPFPHLTMEGIGTPSFVGVAGDIELPFFTLDASAIISTLGAGAFSLPLFALTGSGLSSILGTALLSLPRFTLEVENWLDVKGVASIRLPLLSLRFSMLKGVTGSLDQDIPPLTVSAIGFLSVTGMATIGLPLLSLLASSLPDEYLSMVMNIKNRALTLYDNYDFNSLCRFNGKHLGATKTDIFDLDLGDTDDGTLIEWNFRTGYLDLEQKFKKKIRQAWLSYKSSGDLILTVIQPNGDEFEYLLEGINITETGLRVKFGKGIRSKYIALDIKGIDGSTIALDTLKLQLDQYQKRR